VTARKKKDKPALFTPAEAPRADELTDSALELLQQLAQWGHEGRDNDLTESVFRRRQPQLHFALRTEFGSYANALAVVLKRTLGSSRTRRQLLLEIKTLYNTGQPISLETLLLRDPVLARSMVEEFGSLRSAFEELAIPPGVAQEDRRWESDEVFAEVLALMGDSIGELSEEILEGHALLTEVIRHVFGSFSPFHKAFRIWLEQQPALFVSWKRSSLSRLLVSSLAVTSRASKGRSIGEAQPVQQVLSAAPGYQLYMVSSEGILYPIDASEVPFLTFSAADDTSASRLPTLRRGEKPLEFVSLHDREGWLAMVTARGRLKVIAIDSIKRVRREGMSLLRLASGDKLSAISVLPADYERVAIVTRAGRVVSFPRELVKISSRTSMGVYRLRFDGQRNSEPLAIIGLRGNDDLVLLGKNGNLLRLPRAEVPVRKGASLGRRVWATPVVGATSCDGQTRLVIATRRGRFLCFWDAQVPARQAMRIGVMGIRLDSDDSPRWIGKV
jgi:hypothetical protein